MRNSEQIAVGVIGTGGMGSSWTFWIFALCCSPALWITWKLIPETKGRSLENIEAYWSKSYNNTITKYTSPTVNG